MFSIAEEQCRANVLDQDLLLFGVVWNISTLLNFNFELNVLWLIINYKALNNILLKPNGF